MKKYDIQKDGEFEIVSKSYDYIMEDVITIVDKKEVITPTEKRTSGTHLVRLYPNSDISEQPKEIQDFCKKTWTATKKKAYLAKIKPSASDVKVATKQKLKADYKSDLESMTVEVNGKLFDVAMSSAIAYATTIKHLPDGGKTYWTLANKKLIEVTKAELIEAQGLGEIEGLRLGGLYHLEKSKV